MSLNKTVVLVGMMGSGKSAVGKALAAALAVSFLDSDHEISVAANRSISDIFERDGAVFFRRVESQIIKRLLHGSPCILSTGGGAFMSTENRALIAELGISVFLNADLQLLWERVRHKSSRPLLKTLNPKATLAKIFDDRKAQYAQAELTITSSSSCSIAQTTQNVLGALAQRTDVLNKAGGQL